MFNSYSHFGDDFIAFNYLSDEDRKIYEARKVQYRPRYIWSGQLEQIWNNCLIHMSMNVPGKVAYFSSVETLRMNKPTRTSPEMFLTRYLSNAPDDIKASWEAEVLGKVLPPVAFISNTDAQGWYDIYDQGPGSCMRGSLLVMHYAHPENNLRLAFHQTEEGQIKNRTIVNNKTMAYARIYGEDGAIFAAALRKLGYHHSGNDTLVGETIYVDRETCACCDDELVAGPYLDCDFSQIGNKQDMEDGKSQGVISKRGWTVIYGTDDDGNYRCGSCE